MRNRDLTGYHVVRIPERTQNGFQCSRVLCADPDGLPFYEGTAFYEWVIDKEGCVEGTAWNYLTQVHKVLTHFWHTSPRLLYSASAQEIRDRVRNYLTKRIGCVVRPHRQGNYLVIGSTPLTRNSARLCLTALRRFYQFAILREWYFDINPFVWIKGLKLREKYDHQLSSSQPSHPHKRYGRVPDTYFCVKGGEWRPRIIDDPDLPLALADAFSTRRDRIVASMLFQSGARVSEIVGLTMGDWRRFERECKMIPHGACATDKGARGERVKQVWWSSDTTRELIYYINHERREVDPSGRSLGALDDSDPIFLTHDGAPYTYPAFYYQWRKACTRAGVMLTIHQTRHWFVTQSLRLIESVRDENTREAHKENFVTYMAWRDRATVEVYDHHLKALDFQPVHEAIARLVTDGPVDRTEMAHTVSREDDPTNIPDEMINFLKSHLV